MRKGLPVLIEVGPMSEAEQPFERPRAYAGKFRKLADPCRLSRPRRDGTRRMRISAYVAM